MTVDIISAAISGKIITLEAIDSSEEHLQHLMRSRDDGIERTLTFIFDTEDDKTCKYIYYWLHNQKRVRQANPKNYGEALQAVVGTRTCISGKYLDFEPV